GVAVEFHIDAGESEVPAGDVSLGLERETAETATWRSRLFRPTQRVAQGGGVGGKGAFHLERRPMADVAVERKLERRAGEADLKAGSVAIQRGHEVGEADGGVDRLIMPGEASGCREAARDRWPGERHFHVRKRLDDLGGLVAQDDCAVFDSDLRERGCPAGTGLEIARQGFDVTGPVRRAIGIEDDGDGRAYKRNVGDLDA